MSDLETVLAVDDNPVNLEVIQEALDGFYHVETANNGIEAMEVAKQVRPPVVLLDVMMPGLDGYQVCRQIKQNYELSATRVIMVSARVTLEDKLEGYDAGADSYLTKPFDEDELLAKTDFAIRSRKLEQTCGAIGDVLAVVATLRDSGHLPHLDRTRAYTHLLAERALASLSSSPDERRRFLDELHYACVLKDVGMLAVPSRLLDAGRNSKLSRRDQELLKEHTLIGSRLLLRMSKQAPELSFLGLASAVAESHHERYDGAGYPKGIRGEEIPLAARIAYVVDRFEDLIQTTTPGGVKCFRIVGQKLAAERGSVLDPALTDCFISVLTELERDSVAASRTADNAC